jgi:cytochrome c556
MMARPRFILVASLVGIGCLFIPFAHSQPAAKASKHRLEPVAETKLLMEGLVSPNLNALGKLLADKPPDAEAWGFARGQALLIAESGNLLLLRPPKSAAGEGAWMKHAMELRDAAAALARAAAAKDYDRSRVGLAGVANTCNRCHQTFRVPKRIDPFTQE